MKCAYHATIDAVATCSACGRAICGDCVVDTGGRVTCKSCVEARSRLAAAYGPGNNQSALWSMILGLGGWLLFFLNLLVNFVLLPLATVATVGAGALCGILTIPLCVLPYLPWIIGAILGHMGLSALNSPGNKEAGRGMAVTGLIASYGGIGLSLLGCLIIVAALALGVTVPFIGLLPFLGEMSSY